MPEPQGPPWAAISYFIYTGIRLPFHFLNKKKPENGRGPIHKRQLLIRKIDRMFEHYLETRVVFIES